MQNIIIKLLTGCHDPVAWRFRKRHKLKRGIAWGDK